MLGKSKRNQRTKKKREDVNEGEDAGTVQHEKKGNRGANCFVCGDGHAQEPEGPQRCLWTDGLVCFGGGGRAVVRHFGRLASSNTVLFVDAVFQQPFVHSFCETAHCHYLDPTVLRVNPPTPTSLKPRHAWSSGVLTRFLGCPRTRKGNVLKRSDETKQREEGGVAQQCLKPSLARPVVIANACCDGPSSMMFACAGSTAATRSTATRTRSCRCTTCRWWWRSSSQREGI